MKNHGFIRTAAAVPVVKVADVAHNVTEICRLAGEASEKEVSLIVFPELSLTGATCGDLFGNSLLIKAAEDGVRKIAEFSQGKDITIVVGAPVKYANCLYNTSVIINNGYVKGIVPKVFINYKDDKWFASGGRLLETEITYAGEVCTMSPEMIFRIGDVNFAVEIGADLWAPTPQSTNHVLQGAHIIANLSADKEILMRNEYRDDLLKAHSAKTICGYVYASAGFGERTKACRERKVPDRVITDRRRYRHREDRKSQDEYGYTCFRSTRLLIPMENRGQSSRDRLCKGII